MELSDGELATLEALLRRLNQDTLSTARFQAVNNALESLRSLPRARDVEGTGEQPRTPTTTRRKDRDHVDSGSPPPDAASLRFCASILNQGLYKKIFANSASPIPFKNELFEGHALLMARTDLDTQRYAHRFAGNHYTFEVQVQGKFTRVPPGRVFMGAEITKSMSLGLFTKGMCRAVLQFGRTINRHLHHSFGQEERGDHKHSSGGEVLDEYPHIVGPMWSSADRLVVSKGSDPIPPLGEAFPEEPVSRAARRKNADFNLPFDLDATYSLSFKTSNIDLMRWTATNLPLVSNIDLHTFWSEADLRTVCYCVKDEGAGEAEGMVAGVGVGVGDGGSGSTSRDSAVSIAAAAHPSAMGGAAGGDVRQSISVSSRRSWSAPRTPQLPPFPKRHRQQDIMYIFSILLQHESNHPELLTHDTITGEGSQRDSRSQSPRIQSPLRRRYSNAAILPYPCEDEEDEGDGEEEGDDADGDADEDRREEVDEDSLFFDALDGQGQGEWEWGAGAVATEKATSLSPPRQQLQQQQQQQHAHSNPQPTLPRLSQLMPDPNRALAPSDPSAPPNTNAQFSYSPYGVAAAIEVDEMRLVRQSVGQKGRRTLYAFRVESLLDGRAYSLTSGGSTGAFRGGHLQCVLRTYNEWAKVFPILKRTRQLNRTRLSDTEKRRLDLDNSFRVAVKECMEDSQARAKLESFLVGGQHTTAFLTTTPGIGLGVSAKRLRADLPSFRLESLVIVQSGNHFWSEEFMGLTTDELVFIKPPNRLGIPSRLSVRLESIISVDKVEDAELPFNIAGCAAMIVSTFSRQFVILMRGMSFRNAWVSTLEVMIATAKKTSNPSVTMAHIDLLVRPKGWKLGQRAVLNARAFHCASCITQTRSPDVTLLAQYLDTPHILVARLLNLVLMLADQATSSGSDDCEDFLFGGGANETLQDSYTSFMNGVALLQRIDLSAIAMTEEERLCLFLNLYHCMLLHGFLVVGVPNTSFKSTFFFNSCAYEAFGDVFTLSELRENVVLFSVPSVGVSKGADESYEFSLKSKDPRLLWALNSGRAAVDPAVIPIYEPVSLYDQLDNMVKLSLGGGEGGASHAAQHVVLLDESTTPPVVTVPRLCKHYLRAFELWGLVTEPAFESPRDHHPGAAVVKPQGKLLSFLSHYSPDSATRHGLERACDNESTVVKFSKEGVSDERHRVLKKLSNRLSIDLS